MNPTKLFKDSKTWGTFSGTQESWENIQEVYVSTVYVHMGLLVVLLGASSRVLRVEPLGGWEPLKNIWRAMYE